MVDRSDKGLGICTPYLFNASFRRVGLAQPKKNNHPLMIPQPTASAPPSSNNPVPRVSSSRIDSLQDDGQRPALR